MKKQKQIAVDREWARLEKSAFGIQRWGKPSIPAAIITRRQLAAIIRRARPLPAPPKEEK